MKKQETLQVYSNPCIQNYLIRNKVRETKNKVTTGDGMRVVKSNGNSNVTEGEKQMEM